MNSSTSRTSSIRCRTLVILSGSLAFLVSCQSDPMARFRSLTPEIFIAQGIASQSSPPSTSESKVDQPQDAPHASEPGNNKENIVDLLTVLRLAGAGSLQIEEARERMKESQARLEQASARWVPNLTVGGTYLKHEGQIQETQGLVVQASRNSIFTGAGLTVSVHLGDLFHEPAAAKKAVEAERAAVAGATNETLGAVAGAYLDLQEAEAQLKAARIATAEVQELVQLAEGFSQAGQGFEADAARARNELALRLREKLEVEEMMMSRSIRLAHLIRVDPSIPLHTAEGTVLPMELFSADASLPALIEQARWNLPAVLKRRARVEELKRTRDRERWRPLLPELRVGVSGGGFGGGPGAEIDDFSERGDLIAVLVWEAQNLGLGNRGRLREQEARLRQSIIALDRALEETGAQVTNAYYHAQHRRGQIEISVTNVEESRNSFDLNMTRIRGGEGLPVEALQAVQASAHARNNYIRSVARFNRSQVELLLSVGASAASRLEP